MIGFRKAGFVLLVASTLVCAEDKPLSNFVPEERSTIDSFPMQAVDEEKLASSIVEGALAAPAAGVTAVGAPIYQDPLDVSPQDVEKRDRQTDLGRYEIPVEYRFTPPRQEIGLPANVTHTYQTILTTER